MCLAQSFRLQALDALKIPIIIVMMIDVVGAIIIIAIVSIINVMLCL